MSMESWMRGVDNLLYNNYLNPDAHDLNDFPDFFQRLLPWPVRLVPRPPAWERPWSEVCSQTSEKLNCIVIEFQ